MLSFLEKITFCACLLGPGLKPVSPWNAYLLIFFRSSFNFLLIKWYPAQPKRETEVSSVNSVEFVTKLWKRSLINIKKKRGQRIDLWGTPPLALA